ncbi:lariat debranching enzyme B [Aplysia californica]|uniref:Lariat debranching enzyme B n=1 Tax=Aplysia californica TaxID=6500 RepID=A0ABM0JMD4_APLCA|nr:lariat debranching enzyme B [Aplysia californica]
MKIAVEGCCHGELDAIYETLASLEKENNFKIDLLLVCGDFQSVRNYSDLEAMAVPPKYQQLQTFYKYYSGEKKAPVLTIFIGGNHEASNYLQELSYGGWVAPNIYYLGYAGVVQVGGVRIGGVSGIYKSHDFYKGHFERPPYSNDTKRSVYHVRNLEVFRLKQLIRPLDIFMSHDWPQGIYYHGDTDNLIRMKPFFKKEIEDDTLGSRPLGELLTHLKPTYWFAAHLHVKFAAHVLHQQTDPSTPAKTTKFLALDKCLPRRGFLQVLDVPHKESEGLKIKLDPEWLTVLRTTNHLLKLTPTNTYMPGPGGAERYNFEADDKDLKETVDLFGGDLTLPEKGFVTTTPPLVGTPNPRSGRTPLKVVVNPQTSLLCTMLDLTDPMASFLGKSSEELLEKSFGPISAFGGGSDEMDDDNDDDEANESSAEMPSYIDSSMEVSSTSFSNVSEVAKETPQLSKSQSLSSVLPPPRAVQPSDVRVDDDDEEFLSILSAQKKASPVKALSAPAYVSSSTSGDTDMKMATALSHQRSTGDSANSTSPESSTTASGLGLSSAQQLPSTDRDSGVCSHSSPTASLSSSSDAVPSLGQKASSFGMSSLRLDSTDSSSNLSSHSGVSSSPSTPSPANRKRDSGEGEITGSAVTSSPVVSGSASKRLKRRNISAYADPV